MRGTELDSALGAQTAGVELREAKLDQSLSYQKCDQPRAFTHVRPQAQEGSR